MLMAQAKTPTSVAAARAKPAARRAEGAASTVIHEQVYEKLREAIISGQLEPGRSISVRRLAADFDVSAMPAREAIRQLVAMGALELTDKRRVVIAGMTTRKLEEIREARIALEPGLAGRALARMERDARAKNQLLSRLKKADARLESAIAQGDAGKYARYNYEFHFTLYRRSESSVLLGLVESLWLQFGPFMRIVIGRLGTSTFHDDRHREAVLAIENGDRDKLESAMRADILQGMDTIMAAESEYSRQ